MPPLAIAAFLAIAMFASKRNYGVRYLLPMAPLAIVWISALAERRGDLAVDRRGRADRPGEGAGESIRMN